MKITAVGVRGIFSGPRLDYPVGEIACGRHQKKRPAGDIGYLQTQQVIRKT